MQLIYIDNIDLLSSYGIFLLEEKGIFDPFIAKNDYKKDWPDEHGVELSLDDKLVKERKITLKLGLRATTEASFRSGIHSFMNLFRAAGLRQLRLQNCSKVFMIDVNGSKPLQRLTHYNNSLNVGVFTINLVEPYPVNRQYSLSASSTTVTVGTSDDSVFTIFWGDGSDNDWDKVSAAGGSVGHSYGASGTKYIVIAGRIEKITSLTVVSGTEITSW